jgi:signal transduction histidine kinase
MFDSTEVVVRIDSDVNGRLAPELETVLYRIAREALVNVRKHARAREVRVRLAQSAERLALSIEDDGIGFDSTELMQSPAHHLGLTGIQELAGSLGGHVSVTSGVGAGTRLSVVLPLLYAAAA